MTDREKLIELIEASGIRLSIRTPHGDVFPVKAEDLVDRFIANGVTVQKLDGCEYCKGEFIGENPIVTLGNDCGIDSIVEDDFLYNFCNCGTKSVVEINFCPMCGRRLPQPPKGE